MKKLSIITLVFAMLLTITGCGGKASEEVKEEAKEEVKEEVVEEIIEEETVELIPHTIRGVTISLPVDFEEVIVGDASDNIESSEEKYANVEIIGPFPVSWTVEECEPESIITRKEGIGAEEVTMLDWSNTTTLSDYPVCYAQYTYVGRDILSEVYQYDIFNGDETLTRIEITFIPEENSSLQENIDAILASIVVE